MFSFIIKNISNIIKEIRADLIKEIRYSEAEIRTDLYEIKKELKQMQKMLKEE